MGKQNRLTGFIGFIAAAMIALGTPLVPAQAGMIGTAQQIQHSERAGQIGKIQQFMARDEVRNQMISLGVDPQAASLRVASLTDAELSDLATQIDQAPAGGDGLLALLGLIFVVLIVLELVGVTNIFTAR